MLIEGTISWIPMVFVPTTWDEGKCGESCGMQLCLDFAFSCKKHLELLWVMSMRMYVQRIFEKQIHDRHCISTLRSKPNGTKSSLGGDPASVYTLERIDFRTCLRAIWLSYWWMVRLNDKLKTDKNCSLVSSAFFIQTERQHRFCLLQFAVQRHSNQLLLLLAKKDWTCGMGGLFVWQPFIYCLLVLTMREKEL